MAWALDSGRPIYAQIIERVQLDIITGHYKPGEKLPSVRELASEAAVGIPIPCRKRFPSWSRADFCIRRGPAAALSPRIPI